MTLNKLASEIAKREGKKSQARIGDIREILGIITDIFVESKKTEFAKLVNEIFATGLKRAVKKAKGKRK